MRSATRSQSPRGQRERDGGGSTTKSRRSRSRSRSRGGRKSRRNRDISTSRERSRDRERRRRRAQAECIRRAGGFQKLADSEGHEPVRLFWDGFQWVAKTGHSQSLQSDPAMMNSTRKLRRLYFGNLPLHLGLTETGFQDVVWQEMRGRKFCNCADENPVLYVWFAKDKGNYGFVEFASVEETERALTMDGMNCMGIPLKVSRPNDYSTASVNQTHAMALMGQQAAHMLAGGALAGADGALATPGMPPGLAPPPPPGIPPAMQSGGTRFVKVNQIVCPDSVADDEDYQDILDDVKQGCSRHAEIKSAMIVTPCNASSCHGYNVGDVVFEFGDAEMASVCMYAMRGRKYEGRELTMVSLEESDVNPVRHLLTSD